jgi:thiol-disulfide isomerase/thioredoxin
MWPLYIDAIKKPYIRQKAEQFRDRRLSQKDLATPLPSTPEAELIRNLVAKYPGKFLVIDFWGMTCGPCRSAIQSSKAKRAEIAKRDDIKLVFIAGERTAEGSEAYHNYVKEWLADEETICLTNTDFTRLQELFQFNGIPHYETITPDGRRVRDDLRINGYDNFEYELERLKERMK